MTLECEDLKVPEYERVIKITDKETGLLAIIALHNTIMGPALGGTRIYPYQTFDEALTDVLRLSKGMTYKSAISQTGLGGGKSVIICDPKKKTKELLRAFGRAVDQLNGHYICAEDVGCTLNDVKIIRETTKFVTGLEDENSSGNPAPFTAFGTFRGIQSVIYFLNQSTSLEGKTVAVQGLGSVGEELVKMLFWAGAKLIVSDIDSERTSKIAKQYSAEIVSPDEILYVPCDVLAPCAMGGIINKTSIPKLRCKGIAGCANNQLLENEDGDLLVTKGILYAPDFVINAGGLINVRHELNPSGYNSKISRDDTNKIYQRLLDIYQIAKQNRCSTHKAAMMIADHRIKYHVGNEETQLCLHH